MRENKSQKIELGKLVDFYENLENQITDLVIYRFFTKVSYKGS